MLVGIIVGAIIGIIFKDKATVLSPLGDLFLNMLLVIIVPLIFLTISTSIGKVDKPKRIGKILTSIIVVFIITSLISVLIGIISTRVSLVSSVDSTKIISDLDLTAEGSGEELNILGRTVDAISTNDFVNLLSRNNIIALIVFSIITGIAIQMAKEKGEAFLKVLESDK